VRTEQPLEKLTAAVRRLLTAKGLLAHSAQY
jgi:hypothetical protein